MASPVCCKHLFQAVTGVGVGGGGEWRTAVPSDLQEAKAEGARCQEVLTLDHKHRSRPAWAMKFQAYTVRVCLENIKMSQLTS